MFEHKFGVFPKKKVVYNGELLSIGKAEIDLDKVEVIHRLEPTFEENGHVHFSYDGEKPHILDKTYFHYTKRQSDKVEELLSMLDIEVKRSHSLTKQFKDEYKASVAKKPKNKKVCPHCDSTNIDFVGNKKKGFSVGKAVGGAVLTGGIGTLAGFAGKKGKKDMWHCKNCGEMFELKA